MHVGKCSLKLGVDIHLVWRELSFSLGQEGREWEGFSPLTSMTTKIKQSDTKEIRIPFPGTFPFIWPSG